MSNGFGNPFDNQFDNTLHRVNGALHSTRPILPTSLANVAVVLACADRQKPSILDNKVYVVVYGIVLFLLVQYFIPMVVLTVLNSYVITSLRRSTAYRTGVLLSYRAREPPLGSVRSCNSLTAVAVPTPRKSVQCSSTFESARRVTIIVIVVAVSYTHLTLPTILRV